MAPSIIINGKRVQASSKPAGPDGTEAASPEREAGGRGQAGGVAPSGPALNSEPQPGPTPSAQVLSMEDYDFQAFSTQSPVVVLHDPVDRETGQRLLRRLHGMGAFHQATSESHASATLPERRIIVSSRASIESGWVDRTTSALMSHHRSERSSLLVVRIDEAKLPTCLADEHGLSLNRALEEGRLWQHLDAMSRRCRAPTTGSPGYSVHQLIADAAQYELSADRRSPVDLRMGRFITTLTTQELQGGHTSTIEMAFPTKAHEVLGHHFLLLAMHALRYGGVALLRDGRPWVSGVDTQKLAVDADIASFGGAISPTTGIHVRFPGEPQLMAFMIEHHERRLRYRIAEIAAMFRGPGSVGDDTIKIEVTRDGHVIPLQFVHLDHASNFLEELQLHVGGCWTLRRNDEKSYDLFDWRSSDGQ